jgi:hypothetical protein
VDKVGALPIGFDQLLRDGVAAGHAESARLGRVSKTRVSQTVWLLELAPDIQEEVLHLKRDTGREFVTERSLRAVVAEVEWGRQRGCGRRCGGSGFSSVL